MRNLKKIIAITVCLFVVSLAFIVGIPVHTLRIILLVPALIGKASKKLDVGLSLFLKFFWKKVLKPAFDYANRLV